MDLITVSGTITINGVDSKFELSNEINTCGWTQWGATQHRLADSMYIVQAFQDELVNIKGFYDEEEEE